MSRTTRTLRTVGAAVLAAALTFSLAACGGGDDDKAADAAAKGDKSNPVVIGVVNAAADGQWTIFKNEAEKAGIYVDIKDLGDYQLPNPALTAGELDLNQFQHLQFLAEYNVNAGEDLTPIGATAIYPLSLFSTKHKTLADIPEGAQIAIPNDPTNLARALLTLQDAGLLKLKDGGSASSTELEVLADESTVTVTPVDATQTAINLDTVDGAVVNNDFVKDAKLDPADALYAGSAETEGARPYINVWVARAEDKDNATFLKLVEISHSAPVEEARLEESAGSGVVANQTGPELQGFLEKIQASISK